MSNDTVTFESGVLVGARGAGSIYRRHLGPRLDRIENRLGMAGT